MTDSYNTEYIAPEDYEILKDIYDVQVRNGKRREFGNLPYSKHDIRINISEYQFNDGIKDPASSILRSYKWLVENDYITQINEFIKTNLKEDPYWESYRACITDKGIKYIVQKELEQKKHKQLQSDKHTEKRLAIIAIIAGIIGAVISNISDVINFILSIFKSP